MPITHTAIARCDAERSDDCWGDDWTEGTPTRLIRRLREHGWKFSGPSNSFMRVTCPACAHEQ